MTDVDTTGKRAFVASAAVQRVAAASLRIAQPAATADLISLAMGEPGFDTPPAIRLAADASIETGYTHYAHPNGDPKLRDALASRLNAEHGTGYTTDHILVIHGGTGGLAAAILAIVDPGDRVVIPDPTYSLYADLIRLAGGLPSECRCRTTCTGTSTRLPWRWPEPRRLSSAIRPTRPASCTPATN